MVLLYPWALLALGPMALAALYALRRPVHQRVQVGTLRLWQEALAAAGTQGQKSPRRITLAWALLLAGALSAVGAMTGPVFQSARAGRSVAIEICPGAELAGVEPAQWRRPILQLLERLAPNDRVQVRLPAPLQSPTEPLSPGQAANLVRKLDPLPAPASRLTIAPAAGAQATYRFAPATMHPADGPDTVNIPLPAWPGALTLDAFGVQPAGNQVDLFVAVRNHTDQPARAQLQVQPADQPPVSLALDIPAGARQAIARTFPPAASFVVTIVNSAGPGHVAAAVRQEQVQARVAMIGRDDPLVRRLLDVWPGLTVSGRPEDADLAIAIGVEPPAGRPAIAIDPPAPPAPLVADGVVGPLTLADADLAADSPLLAHVNLSDVRIRRAQAWRGTEGALARVGTNVLIAYQPQARRVSIAFDPAADNTNWTATDSFVIFMTNALYGLLPSAPRQTRYAWRTPLGAGAHPNWTLLAPAGGVSPGPVPSPGLYRDRDGQLHAIALPGLQSATAPSPTATISLPPPQDQAAGRSLTPALLLLAAGCWLAGWWARSR